MPAYLKLAMRFTVLSALVLGTITMKPARANAFSCETDCYQARSLCISGCYVGFPTHLDPDCTALCQEESWACLSCCSDPSTC